MSFLYSTLIQATREIYSRKLPCLLTTLRRLTPVALGLYLLGATGCYTHVVHKRATQSGKGIRYYQSAPYLLVYSDGKNGLQWQILFLPDQSRMMTVRPTVYWGRSEMDLYFHNGIMTGSSELSDTTQIPTAVIAAVQSALPLIAKAAAFEVKPNVFPPPYLFKIQVEHGHVTFLGKQGEAKIIVPVIKPTSP